MTEPSTTPQPDDSTAAIAELRGRARLDNVRLQRLLGETVADPPFDVAQVAVSAAAPELAVEGRAFACRLTYRIALLDSDGWDLGTVEMALILDYRVEGDIPPHSVIAAFVDETAASVALPYVRETVQSVMSRLGIAMVLVLSESELQPTEVRLIGGVMRSARPQAPVPTA